MFSLHTAAVVSQFVLFPLLFYSIRWNTLTHYNVERSHTDFWLFSIQLSANSASQYTVSVHPPMLFFIRAFQSRVSGSGSTSSGSPLSDEDEESTLPKSRSAPSSVQLEQQRDSRLPERPSPKPCWQCCRHKPMQQQQIRSAKPNRQSWKQTNLRPRSHERPKKQNLESRWEWSAEAVHASNGVNDGEARGEAVVDRLTVKNSFNRYNHTVMATSTASCVKSTRHAGCVFCLVLSKGGEREDTCDDGLSRWSLRIKPPTSWSGN